MAARAERRPAPRTVLFALLPTAIVLSLLELALAVFGAGGERRDLSRGFGGGARYLVEQPDGSFRTTMFVLESEEQTVPPPGDALRVVLFGGSNTEGFFHDWLEARLDEAGAEVGRDVEVVNLGRRGYGSARVRALFGQALELDPDLCVVYSGHNEFVEAGFRLDVEAATGGARGGLVAALDAAAGNLRSYRALQGAFAAGAAPTPRRPQEWAFEHEKFADTTWPETRERFGDYRENLEAIARQAAEARVPLVLCTVVGNDFAAPFVSTPPVGLDAAGRAELDRRLARARAAQPDWTEHFVPPTPADRLHFEDWLREDGPTLTSDRQPRAVRYGPPFAAVERWWSYPETWSPRVEPLLRAQYAVRTGALAPEGRAALEASLGPLEAALELAPDHPEALFRLGLARLALAGGDDAAGRAAAAELLRRAAAADRAPRRGNATSNAVVREVAAERAGVTLVDLARAFRERAPDGLMGFEMMRDECHFHMAPRYVVMADLAEALTPLLFPALDAAAEARAREAWARAWAALLERAGE